MKLPSLDELVLETGQTIKRFPFVLLSAVTVGTLCWLLLDEVSWVDPGHVFAAVLGIALFFGIDLFFARNKSDSLHLIARILGLGALIAYALVVGGRPEDDVTEIYRFGLFLIVVHLFVAVAPFLRGGSVEGFWEFNKTLFLRFLMAVLFSGVLFGGLAVAMLAIDKLLLGGDVIEEEAYAKLFITIGALFNTLFFLAGVPKDLASLEGEREYPKGLKIFAQNLLLPLVVLYMTILYVYAVSILINWEWPEGWVGWLVLSFSVLGILALLLLQPLRKYQESSWIVRFARWFYVAVLPLIALLFAAIARRIAEYGITENRYFVVLLACWLGGIAIYFIVSRRRNIKVIPISLGLVALFSSFGPWGAFAVSTSSQTGRFEELAQENKMLVNGRIDSTKAMELDEDERDEMHSILSYLSQRDELDRIEHLVEGGIEEEEDAWEIAARIGIGYDAVGGGLMKADQEYFSFALPSSSEGGSIEGFDFLLPEGSYSYSGSREDEARFNPAFKVTYEGKEYSVLFRAVDPEILVRLDHPDSTRRAGADTVLRFPLDSVLAQRIEKMENESDTAAKDHGIETHTFVLDMNGESIKGRVIVRSLDGFFGRDAQGNVIPNEIGVQNISFLLLLGKSSE